MRRTTELSHNHRQLNLQQTRRPKVPRCDDRERPRPAAIWGSSRSVHTDGFDSSETLFGPSTVKGVTDLDEAISRLRRLDEPAPRPLKLPAESEVRDAEQRAGVRLHNDLRRYLLEASDVAYGTVEPVTINGGHTSIDTVISNARSLGVPDTLVPICEDNSDFYCMTETGEVVFWSHDGTTDERWPDLASWIVEVWIGGS